MILQALVEHYHRLSDDAESDVAPFGFSRQKVGFTVVVTPDGQLHGIEPLNTEVAGRSRPLSLVLPGQSKPSGAGINPCFLWDNATYMLGAVPEGREAAWARARWEAFRDRHVSLIDEIKDPAFTAVCEFLKGWDPKLLADRTDLEALQAGFGVFSARAQTGYVHERPTIVEWWRGQLAAQTDDDADAALGQCLVTGKVTRLARLHEPKIKGVSGGQPAGTSIVSFNDSAYCSYGKEQSFNAPVSEAAAFEYATGLNALLSDRNHRVQLGDTTCVFWTQTPTLAEPAVLGLMSEGFWQAAAEGEADDKDARTRGAVRDFYLRLRSGREADASALGDPSVPFYVLGLSPNASRISVRFWHVSTVGEMAQRLARHVRDLEMVGRREDDPPLTIRQLLLETAREPKDIPPQLAGELARSILTGGPYPRALALAVNRRIRADREINHRRVAILKAWLNRHHTDQSTPKEVPVSLDPNRTDPPYLLGRLFAVYEKVQKDALGEKLNRTIRDSYLSAASATPASVFPRLYRLSQHHLNRIESVGLRISRERLLGQIFQHLQSFPSHLNLQSQGLFAIGYYHQTQDLYTRKTNGNEAATAQETTTNV
jgi:CRISPR-associated protein Csd1